MMPLNAYMKDPATPFSLQATSYFHLPPDVLKDKASFVCSFPHSFSSFPLWRRLIMYASLASLLLFIGLSRAVSRALHAESSSNSHSRGSEQQHQCYNSNDPSSRWTLDQFDSLITFGDSYTDENRLTYFVTHQGQPPPAGTYFNESLRAASGGRVWARYVVQYTGKTTGVNVDGGGGEWDPALRLYNYATSGAVCDNRLSPRAFTAIGADFPDLAGYGVPAFVADRNVSDTVTGRPYFEPPLTADGAVFAVWDGTNDLGNYAFLTDSQRRGATLVDYTNCIFDQLDTLYAAGARYFVLMNVVPLNRAPLYANLNEGGVTAARFWSDKPEYFGGNVTLINEKMREQVALINDQWKYKLPYEILLGQRYPGSSFALFDVNRLVGDIIANPTQYLNGSRPANVTGYDAHCTLDGSDCPVSGSPDSFLWYDELHPSEQADRVIAREFVDILAGNGTYATYYDGPCHS